MAEKTWHSDYCEYPDCNCAEVYEPIEEPPEE
jgi:hypothetical protein